MHPALINLTAPAALAGLLHPILLPESPPPQHPLRGVGEARMHTVGRLKGDSTWGFGRRERRQEAWCTEKAMCFRTANKPVTFATLPGLVSKRHPAGWVLWVFVGCLGWSVTWATESPSPRSCCLCKREDQPRATGACAQTLPSSHRVTARGARFPVMKWQHFHGISNILGFLYLIYAVLSRTLSRMRKGS